MALYGLVPEVVVIPFDEGRPIRREGPFDASADRPAGSCLFDLGGFEGKREIRIMQVPPLVLPGPTAPHVPQRLRQERALPEAGKAEAAGDARDRIGLHTETGVGETCRIRVPAVDVGR